MADIVIPLGETVEVPAVPSKSFSDLYVMDLNIRAHEGGPQDSLYVEYVPYDKATGERLLTDRREIRVPLWQTINDLPEAAQSFASIATAIPALVAYQAALNAPVEVVPAE